MKNDDKNDIVRKKLFNNEKKNWKSNYTTKTHSKISKKNVVTHKNIHKSFSNNKTKEIFKNKKSQILEVKKNDSENGEDNNFFLFDDRPKEKMSENEKNLLFKLDKILFNNKNMLLEKKKEDFLIKEKFENVKISQETTIDSKTNVSETISQKELLTSLRFLFLNFK